MPKSDTSAPGDHTNVEDHPATNKSVLGTIKDMWNSAVAEHKAYGEKNPPPKSPPGRGRFGWGGLSN